MAVPRAFFGPSAPGGDGAAALGGSFFVRGPSSSRGGGADDDAEESPLLVHVSKGGLLQKQKWTSRSAPTTTRPLGRAFAAFFLGTTTQPRPSGLVFVGVVLLVQFCFCRCPSLLTCTSRGHSFASSS